MSLLEKLRQHIKEQTLEANRLAGLSNVDEGEEARRTAIPGALRCIYCAEQNVLSYTWVPEVGCSRCGAKPGDPSTLNEEHDVTWPQDPQHKSSFNWGGK